MTQHLGLFVADPDDPGLTYLHSYGPVQNGFSHGLTIGATLTAELRAAVTGTLSAQPFYYHGVEPGEPLEAGTATPRPKTITLYLQPDLGPSLDPEWKARAQAAGLGHLVGFAYGNVDVSTLQETLEASLGSGRLSQAIVPPGAMSNEEIMDKFLVGGVDLAVQAGDVIGLPALASVQASPPEWRFSFYVYTSLFDPEQAPPYLSLGTTGPVDPAAFYDEMRDFVADGSEMVDALLGHAPKTWPLLPGSGYSLSDAIEETAVHVYPMPVLRTFAWEQTLTEEQWTQVWGNQKALYRRHLLATVDPDRLDAQAQADAQGMPRFSFNDSDAYNPIQLEALVEFYVNFSDPYGPVDYVADPNDAYAPITRPLSPGDAGYQTVELGQGTGWHLIIIQSFGARKNLAGSDAAANGSTIELLTQAERIEDLDQSLPVMYSLMRVNAGFDTIYLDGDTARASGVYRITGVNASSYTVTVDATPDLGSQPSAWRIPAGIGGKHPQVDYNLGPGGSEGYDHHDGALFLVKDGQIHGIWRGSSYSSRDKYHYQYPLPSARGNRGFYFRSHTSGSSETINYAFRIMESEDQPETDRSLPVRYYFYNQVEDGRSGGGLGHAIHRGFPGSPLLATPVFGNGSLGCMPILQFFDFRRKLIEVYADDQEGSGLSVDPRLMELAGLDEPQSELAWCREHPTSDSEKCVGILPSNGGPAAGQVTEFSKAWSNLPVNGPDESKYLIEGTLWVIHPHEVPRHQSEY